jgi:hypothetical protein
VSESERERERREEGGSAMTLYICVREYAATNGWGGRDVCMERCVYVCMCVFVCCMCVDNSTPTQGVGSRKKDSLERG